MITFSATSRVLTFSVVRDLNSSSTDSPILLADTLHAISRGLGFISGGYQVYPVLFRAVVRNLTFLATN